MRRVGYGKIGRVIEVDPAKWGESGGDNEPPALLLTLARRHPDVMWVVLGRNSGWVPPLPNIENPWQEWIPYIREHAQRLYRVEDQSIETYYWSVSFYDDLIMKSYDTIDGMIVWCGQHGTSNSPIPKVSDRSVYTKSQISQVHYGSHLVRGVNFWRRNDPVNREEIWLDPDVRNYIKARDFKWPRRHPILSQFDWERVQSCERYGDTRTPQETGFGDLVVKDGLWVSKDRYIASGLELVGIEESDDDWLSWEDRDKFGVIINEARGYGMKPELTRLDAMQRYIKPLDPSWVYGTWSKDSLAKLEMDIRPLAYDQLNGKVSTVKSTFTTPSSGSGWATAKPWESFAAGTICFFHPLYDTQGHIVPKLGEHDPNTEDGWLAAWLRVRTPEELKQRVDLLNEDRDTFMALQQAQTNLLKDELHKQRCITTIEKRLGL